MVDHTDFMYGKESNMKTNNVMLAALETNVILHTRQCREHPTVKNYKNIETATQVYLND